MKRAVVAFLCALAGAATAQQVSDYTFMPDGGRGLLLRVFGTEGSAALATDPDVGSGVVAAWTTRITALDAGLDDKQVRTLAGFLAFSASPPEWNLSESPDVAPVPRDGRDIALAECQSCHSLFTGYLMQKRNVDGWLSVFKSPFHMTMHLTESERRVFADYSAVNMPVRPEDVPPELRF